MIKNIFEKLFKDPDGNVVIGQFPNLPIIIWILTQIVLYFDLLALYRSGVIYLSYASLFTWAYLELFYGVNLWRRLLGLSVILFLLIRWFLL